MQMQTAVQAQPDACVDYQGSDKYFLLKLVPGQVACKKDLPGRIKRLSTTTMEAWQKWLIIITCNLQSKKEKNSCGNNAFDVSVVLLK